RDLQAGTIHHCIPILVRTGKGVTTEPKLAKQNHIALQQSRVFDDLAQVVDYLLADQGAEKQ
ncbi:MAG: D-glycero-beta-D-manno-heptose-1,7-bisphosphate 7-phosphatase, partial [Porticoccus sp.]